MTCVYILFPLRSRGTKRKSLSVGDARLAVQACDDGTFRSDMAADMLTEQGGYTNLSVIEGGIDGYAEPPRSRRVCCMSCMPRFLLSGVLGCVRTDTWFMIRSRRRTRSSGRWSSRCIERPVRRRRPAMRRPTPRRCRPAMRRLNASSQRCAPRRAAPHPTFH